MIVILGDIGGQAIVFKKILKKLGINLNELILPPNMIIIQLGDIIRLYPNFKQENTEIISLVNKLIIKNPTNWIQLLGNHEIAFFGGPFCTNWDKAVSQHSENLLINLWEENKIYIACGVTTFEDNNIKREYLASHAGLTKSNLELMKTVSLQNVVSFLNKDIGTNNVISTPGWYYNKQITLTADAQWAEVNQELYLPWLKEKSMPFSQIHGHNSPYFWLENRRQDTIVPEVKDVTHIDNDRRITVTSHSDGNKFYAIDWTMGNTIIKKVWKPFIIPNGDLILFEKQ